MLKAVGNNSFVLLGSERSTIGLRLLIIVVFLTNRTRESGYYTLYAIVPLILYPFLMLYMICTILSSSGNDRLFVGNSNIS